MNTRDKNLDLLKEQALNGLKQIYRTSITVSSSIQDLSTVIASIATAGLGVPRAMTISVVSSELSNVVARYTLNGTNPVATTTGDPLWNKSKELIQEFYNIQRFKITEEASYTTKVEVAFYK